VIRLKDSPATRASAGTFIWSISQGIISGSPIAPAPIAATRSRPSSRISFSIQILASRGGSRRMPIFTDRSLNGPSASAIALSAATASLWPLSKAMDHAAQNHQDGSVAEEPQEIGLLGVLLDNFEDD